MRLGTGLGTAEVVPVKEASGKVEKLIILKPDPACEEFAYMNDVGLCLRRLGGKPEPSPARS